jgi:hypothetical protein
MCYSPVVKRKTASLAVMQFYVGPDDEQGPATIWSILLYTMLLVETLNIDDDILRQRFGIVVPIEDPDLGSKIDARKCRHSGTTTEVDKILSHSGKVRNRFSLVFRDWS